MDVLTLALIAGGLYLFTRNSSAPSAPAPQQYSPVPGPGSSVDPYLPTVNPEISAPVAPVPAQHELTAEDLYIAPENIVSLPTAGGGAVEYIGVTDPNDPAHYTTYAEQYNPQLDFRSYTPWMVIQEHLTSVYPKEVWLDWFGANKANLTVFDPSTYAVYGGREVYWNKMVEAMSGVLSSAEIGSRPF